MDAPGTLNLPPAQAVVTGASSGIGLCVTRRLQRAGFQVFGCARRQVPAAETESEESESSGPPVVSIKMDLARLTDLPDALAALARRIPRLEVLVLAAGRGHFGSLEQSSPDQIRELVELNITAQLFVCRALLPIMKRNNGGKVIFIGSEAGLRGKRQGAVYCATKFAVRGMAQALRDECATSDIGVSVVQPGMVRTPFFEDLSFEPGPNPENALNPEDVAEAVEYIVSVPTHAVVDEIELSPLKRVVQKRTP